MKIVVVSLNPSIDWQYSVENFALGELNRVECVRQDVGGKGINVCVALKNLGLEPICTGINFSQNGDVLTNKLDMLGICHDFVNVDGAIRTNIKLYENSSGAMTELNQPGAFVPEDALDLLAKKICGHEEDSILVLSGSLPKGVPADYYSRLCENWAGKVILDADGDALSIAVDGNSPPFAIKPNLSELENTFNINISAGISAPKDIAEFCRTRLISKGVSLVCVSMGDEGAVLVTKSGAWFCPALDVDVKAVQGAGDSMVAGILYAMHCDLPEEKYLTNAVAAAAASVILDGTDMCTREGFEMMYAHTRLLQKT